VVAASEGPPKMTPRYKTTRKQVRIAGCYASEADNHEIIILLSCCAFPLSSARRYGAERKRTLAATLAAGSHHSRQLGIAHVYGKSDADAVFGMIYAQAEDDFNRIERNYLIALVGWRRRR